MTKQTYCILYFMTAPYAVHYVLMLFFNQGLFRIPVNPNPADHIKAAAQDQAVRQAHAR